VSTHAKNSPSQISRIIRCPGSTDFVQYLIQKNKIPATETSIYANEGTMLHDQQERVVNNKPFTEVLDAEQEEAIAKNWHWLLSLEAKHKLTWIQTERRVSLNGYGIEDGDGTADIVAGSSTRTLHVADWKFGRGVPGYVEKNEQLMDYLLGAAEDQENLEQYDELWIHLAQPRLDYFGSYRCNVNELMGLINAIKNAQKSHDIVAGEKQCFWCRGKMHCAEWDAFNKGHAATVFMVNDLMKQNEYDYKLMVKALALEPMFKKVFKTIRDSFYEMNSNQLKAIELKRVAGRSNRKYISDDDVVEYLCNNYSDIEDIYETPKLKTPAKIEKLIKGIKKDPGFQKLIHKPLGKPTIVSIHDKRPEYQNDAKSVFGHLASKSDYKPEDRWQNSLLNE
jgi:hypothetical protein